MGETEGEDKEMILSCSISLLSVSRLGFTRPDAISSKAPLTLKVSDVHGSDEGGRSSPAVLKTDLTTVYSTLGTIVNIHRCQSGEMLPAASALRLHTSVFLGIRFYTLGSSFKRFSKCFPIPKQS